MKFAWRSFILIALSLSGSAYISSISAQTPPPLPQRGQLLESPPALLGVYSVSDLISKITDGTISRWLLRRTFTPQCAVAVYQLRYGTVGGLGEPTTASGALMIPNGSDWVCQNPRATVLYAHGKRNLRSFNIADISGQTNYEGLLLALALAGDGYIVVAPNYAGYDSSTLPYHAFLHADQQAADMMDGLIAARAAIPATGVVDNLKLFITGYSQGGYVAMATHRTLQAAGFAVTASAPMSGPYALSAFGDAVFMGEVGRGAVQEFLMLASSYQQAYGNLFSTPTEIFEEKYASALSLLPGTTATDTLVAEGRMPESALFSSTPPTPELMTMTPATTDVRYAEVFASGFGPDHLITNSYRLGYLQDVFVMPDGGYPNTTTSLPPANPTHPLRVALKNNDLRNWSPTAPVLLCGGDEDPVVFFFNTLLMQGYWAVNAPNSLVTVLNVDAPPSQRGPYRSLKRKFAETKRLMKWIEGEAAVRREYHDVLVPAFCLQGVRSFFNEF
jgi:pimeloyl-ACP methyl ester carboxylesterase